MLRVAIRKVFTWLAECEDPEELRSHLGVLVTAALNVAGLMKVQKYLEEKKSEVSNGISQAIMEVNKEMRLSLSDGNMDVLKKI